MAIFLTLFCNFKLYHTFLLLLATIARLFHSKLLRLPIKAVICIKPMYCILSVKSVCTACYIHWLIHFHFTNELYYELFQSIFPNISHKSFRATILQNIYRSSHLQKWPETLLKRKPQGEFFSENFPKF